MSGGCDPGRIEALYHRYGNAGGQENQLALAVEIGSDDISAKFQETVIAVQNVRGRGPFYPAGTRTALFDLAESRGPLGDGLKDTEHVQALLWSPPRWEVEGRPDLNFLFVARELNPGSAVDMGKRSWVIDEDCRVSADLLLMNIADRTPIVAEIKVGGDENADYALVQALAAAAQLTPAPQRDRLRVQYSDYFGREVPERLDVYIIVTQPPPRGTRPKLLDRALAHAAELMDSKRLNQWVRQIVFLEAKAEAGELKLHVLDKPSSDSG